MAAIVGLIMMGGGVLGAGFSGYSGAQSACKNAQNALNILQEAQNLQDQWNNVITQEVILDDTIKAQISQSYQNIANLQADIQQNQAQSKKQKTVIVTIGACVIVGVFFCLLTKYFLKEYLPLAAAKKKSASHIHHKA
jgi:predicted PurR-regulated permease PerM